MYPTTETEQVPATEEIIQQVIDEAAASGCPISLEITRNLDGSTSFENAYHVEEYISHVEEFTVETYTDPSDALHDVLERFLPSRLANGIKPFSRPEHVDFGCVDNVSLRGWQPKWETLKYAIVPGAGRTL